MPVVVVRLNSQAEPVVMNDSLTYRGPILTFTGDDVAHALTSCFQVQEGCFSHYSEAALLPALSTTINANFQDNREQKRGLPPLRMPAPDQASRAKRAPK